MRRFLLCLFLAVVLAGLAPGSGLTSAASALHAQEFRQVNIRVTCDGDEVDEVNIRPWVQRASGTQQLRWRLLPASNIASATIQPKTARWPFASTPPLTVSSGGNATVDSGPITGDDGQYLYDIIVDCGSGPTIIDPRMDIGG